MNHSVRNQHQLEELDQAKLRRVIRQLDSSSGAKVTIEGRELINFASNDYLGLGTHTLVKQAFVEGTNQFGAGSGSSRLISGTLPPHTQLEETLSQCKGTQAALTFSSGYACSVGTLTSLLEKTDTVILDKLCHASLIDGARLSGAKLRVFPHLNLHYLENILKKSRQKNSSNRLLIVTESVFSMDGDLCDLAKLVELKNTYDAELLVDEAHGLGVLGSTGMGLAETCQLQSEIDYQLGTLSKAVGVAGGYVACSQVSRELIFNRARSWIYSTAPPPGQAQAAIASLKIIQSPTGLSLRKKLWENIKFLSESLREISSESAILPWIVEDNKTAVDYQSLLRKQGFWVPAIRYPTVPKNQARLRISLRADHSLQDLQKFLQTFQTIVH